MTPPDYAWHFTPGSAFAHRVVACDPFVCLGEGEAEPFTVAVEPGRYRAEAAVATLARAGSAPDPRRIPTRTPESPRHAW
ncbi:hypothetical protein ACIOG8_14405 [Streptomyces erythrochromogenes]|uniref:hypothetical protein n=1 Tax=Streptomyces erythrochromogenes TaxID=285574 RepID=UPI0038156F49